MPGHKKLGTDAERQTAKDHFLRLMELGYRAGDIQELVDYETTLPDTVIIVLADGSQMFFEKEK